MSGLRILSQSLKAEPYNCQNLVNNSFCPDRGGSVFRIKVPLVVTILLVWIWFQWKKVDKKVCTNTNCGEKPGNGERKKEKKFIMDSTNTFFSPDFNSRAPFIFGGRELQVFHDLFLNVRLWMTEVLSMHSIEQVELWLWFGFLFKKNVSILTTEHFVLKVWSRVVSASSGSSPRRLQTFVAASRAFQPQLWRSDRSRGGSSERNRLLPTVQGKSVENRNAGGGGTKKVQNLKAVKIKSRA